MMANQSSNLTIVSKGNKDSYYLAMSRTQLTIRKDDQNWEPWLGFFLKTMAKQKDNPSPYSAFCPLPLPALHLRPCHKQIGHPHIWRARGPFRGLPVAFVRFPRCSAPPRGKTRTT